MRYDSAQKHDEACIFDVDRITDGRVGGVVPCVVNGHQQHDKST